METSRKTTVGLVAGLAFGVVYLLGWGLQVAGLPDEFPPTPEELVAYNEEHAGTAMAGSIVMALSIAAFIWFLAVVKRALQRAQAGGGYLAEVAFGGGLVGAGVLLVATSARFMPAMRADDGSLDAAVATSLGDLQAHLAGSTAPLALGVLVAATAAGGLRHGLLPRWLSWVSAVLAAAMIVPAAPWLASMLFPFWVIAVSVVLHRRRSLSAERGAQAATVPEQQPV